MGPWPRLAVGLLLQVHTRTAVLGHYCRRLLLSGCAPGVLLSNMSGVGWSFCGFAGAVGSFLFFSCLLTTYVYHGLSCLLFLMPIIYYYYYLCLLLFLFFAGLY